MTTLYVFVAGPNDSGKTKFLYSLGIPEGFMRDEATGIEFRRFTIDQDLEVEIFCALDASRFDHLMDIQQRDLLGYIVLVDSTAPDTWDLARVIIENCRGYARMPMVIAANKQDLSGAHKPEQIGGWLGLDGMTTVCGASVIDPTSARNVFLQLLYAVKHEIERLDTLIAELEKLTAQGNAL